MIRVDKADNKYSRIAKEDNTIHKFSIYEYLYNAPQDPRASSTADFLLLNDNIAINGEALLQY